MERTDRWHLCECGLTFPRGLPIVARLLVCPITTLILTCVTFGCLNNKMYMHFHANRCTNLSLRVQKFFPSVVWKCICELSVWHGLVRDKNVKNAVTGIYQTHQHGRSGSPITNETEATNLMSRTSINTTKAVILFVTWFCEVDASVHKQDTALLT